MKFGGIFALLIVILLLMFKREKNFSYFLMMAIVFSLITILELVCFFKCFEAIRKIQIENFLIITIGSFILKSIIFTVYTGCAICTNICVGIINQSNKLEEENIDEKIEE